MADFTKKDLSRLKALMNTALDPNVTDAECHTAFTMAKRLIVINQHNPLKFDANGNVETSVSDTINKIGYNVPASWINFFITELCMHAFDYKIRYKINIEPADPKDQRVIAMQAITISFNGNRASDFKDVCNTIVDQINNQIKNRPDPFSSVKKDLEKILREQRKAAEKTKGSKSTTKSSSSNVGGLFKIFKEWLND